MAFNKRDRPLPLDPIAMVGIDLDGTLLRSDGTISMESAQVIAEVIQRGVKVVICTARPPRGAKAIHESLGLETLVVNNDGALIQQPDLGQIFFHQQLSSSLARTVIGVARACDPNLSVAVESDDRLYSDRASKVISADRALCAGSNGYDHFDAILTEPVTKVVFVGDADSLSKVYVELSGGTIEDIAVTYSHRRLLQIVHSSVSKGKGLAKVADYYKIPRNQVMAIGDAPNDLSMIKWAGLGVAMTNAWTQIRAAAHLVVPSNDDDGVAYALKRYVL